MATDLFPVPEELAAPEQPALLRRHRRAEPSESHSRKKPSRWVGKIFLVAVAVGGVSCVLWLAQRWVLEDPRFGLARVLVRGGKFVAATEVEEKFGPDLGKSLLQVPLAERRRQVEQIPWVHSAVVGRVFPNQVWVAVQERTPIAFVWTPEGLSLVDEEGVFLDCPPEASFTFPVVRGVSPQEAASQRRARMQLFAALMKELAQGGSGLGTEISEVDLSDPQDARVVVAEPSGAVLLHLGQKDFLTRYLTYAAHIAEWKQKFPHLYSVDLRYEGQVVLNADPQENRPGAAGGRSWVAGPSASAVQPRVESQIHSDRTRPAL